MQCACSVHVHVLLMGPGSRGVALFGLGAAVGLSTAVLIDRWRRQRDPDSKRSRLNDEQLQGTVSDINSKYFK